jgi:ankyrin repeat protein
MDPAEFRDLLRKHDLLDIIANSVHNVPSIPNLLAYIDLKKKDKNGNSVLHIAALHGENLNLIRALLCHPDIDPNLLKNSKQQTPIEYILNMRLSPAGFDSFF